MVIRIVKLTFREDFLEEAVRILGENHEQIGNFNGCRSLEVLKDVHSNRVIITHSHWLSEDHLNAYRDSGFFREVWAKLKPGFSERPQAWSLQSLEL